MTSYAKRIIGGKEYVNCIIATAAMRAVIDWICGMADAIRNAFQQSFSFEWLVNNLEI
jgi:hypothetical protein